MELQQFKRLLIVFFFIIIANICGVLIAIWVFKHFNIYIPLKNQAVAIDLQEPLQVQVKVKDALNVDVKGRVNANIPINEKLNIPLTQTLTPRVYFDNMVPISTVIPVKETLKVDQSLPIDTKVQVRVLGKDITLPLKGNIPLQLDVPIDIQVPLDQKVHLKFDAPVKTVLKENLHIRLNAQLKTNIPIQGSLNVPVKTALNASVDVKNTLPVKIEHGELKIPLSSMSLNRVKSGEDNFTCSEPDKIGEWLMFGSLKSILISFFLIMILTAILFWFYLNIQASVVVSAHESDIRLPESLETKIHVGNNLQVQSIGKLDTSIDIDRQISVPLKGRYLADLEFEVETPITVSVDYATTLKVDQVMPLETTTDLIYKNKLLPRFPLKLNIPIKLDIPFQLKRSYTIPVKIAFNGPVYFEFDESINLPIKHQFNPSLNVNDAMEMGNISSFNAIMYNSVQHTKANLDMKMDLPLRNVHP